MTINNPLKNCPICYAENAKLEHHVINDYPQYPSLKNQVNAKCSKCGHILIGHGETKEIAERMATEAWNGFYPK